MDKEQKVTNMTETVWANALLSDNQLLFWHIGNKQKTCWLDFASNFYKNSIPPLIYMNCHKIHIESKQFLKTQEKEIDSFFRQWDLVFNFFNYNKQQ